MIIQCQLKSKGEVVGHVDLEFEALPRMGEWIQGYGNIDEIRWTEIMGVYRPIFVVITYSGYRAKASQDGVKKGGQ